MAMVNSLLLEPTYWNWLLLGLVLIIAEILAPGICLVWFGVGALAVGGILFLLPTVGWQLQWLLFVTLSMGSIVVWWLYDKNRSDSTQQTSLNRRGQQYVGRVFTLDTPIVNRQGRVRIDDSSWKIQGPDCPAGTRVRIVGVDGIVLKVTADGP